MTQDRTSENSSQSQGLAAGNCDKIVAALDRPLILIGMMGSGKSRVGQYLGAALNLPYIDSDQEIERACGCTIADYFSRYGEDAFRDGEHRVLTRLLDGTPKIISAGGGIVVREANRALLKQRSIPVWLQADVPVLVARCAGNDRRPLLQDGDPHAILAGILDKRLNLYAETAILTADSNHEDAQETVREVLDALKRYLKV